jgi:hypothetical protein
MHPGPRCDHLFLDRQGSVVKTVHTAHGSFLTGNEIADAVTRFGLALARRREMDVVEIPYLAGGGEIHRVEFRVGWSAETVVTSDDAPADELIEVDTIMSLLNRTSALASHQAVRGGEWTEGRSRSAVNWDEII